MAVHDGQLFVGTMDESNILSGTFNSATGADLYRFLPADIPGIPESLNGVGNPFNYGVRNMLSTSSGLYMGMANPMNLARDANNINLGGWELIKLQRDQGVFPKSGSKSARDKFSIVGTGFGSARGSVYLNNRIVDVLYWSDNYIYCQLNSRVIVGSGNVDVVNSNRTTFTFTGANAFNVNP